MPKSPTWAGRMLLRTPESLRRIRNVPIIGSIVHRLSRRMLAPDELVWARVDEGPCKGLWLELNPRTGQSYLRGQAERAVQDVLAKRLRPGMIFYDLGANIGLFSVLAARLVGSSGQVFSFEPDSEVAARLRRNAERNSFTNVTVVEAGIWSRSGEMAFIRADQSSPDHGTGALTTNNDGSTVGVRCISLDDFTQGAPPPDVIKCDIEGAEAEMLRGAINTLTSHKPSILCEIHSQANENACQQILRGLGYTCEHIDSNHIFAIQPRSGT